MQRVTEPAVIEAIEKITADLQNEVAVAVSRARLRLRRLGLGSQDLVRLPGQPPQAGIARSLSVHIGYALT